MAALSEMQMQALKTVAAGECINPFFGNCNVDNRSLRGLKKRGLIETLVDPWRVEVTDAGREVLAGV